MVDLEREIRVRLEAVVQGLPLHQFEDWFVPLLGADYQAEEGVQNLLSEIHIALAEYSSGDLSLEDLKVRLRMLAKDETGSTAPRLEPVQMSAGDWGAESLSAGTQGFSPVASSQFSA